MKFYLTPWSGKRASEARSSSILALFYFVLYIFDGVSASITWRVLEESKPGTLVGNLQRYTASFSNYNLAATSRKNFVYDKSTGNVNTKKAIDRDVLSNLCVNGSEFETIQFTSTKNSDSKINVKVFVDDINDNWPQFTSDIFTGVIAEEIDKGYTIKIPIAHDKDCGVNGTLQYEILNTTDSKYFTLKLSTNEEFLDVILVRKLDRETKEFHILDIQACDNANPSRCNSTILNITVTDFNDNKPTFHNLKSEVYVKEKCATGSKSIVKLNVTDKDSGKNGQFTLSVSYTSGQLFVITNNQYLESTKCLIYDKKKPYTDVVINVLDHGVPVQRNDFSIRVVVLDINDHDPVLSMIDIKTVYENMRATPYVAIIKADDDDDGENANVSLKILNGNTRNQFYLVKLELPNWFFYMKLNGTLDREEMPVYNITIEGSDHGMPPRTSFIHVIIPVLDQNDNHPICSFPKENISLSEASPVGSFVSVVQAVDIDEGGNGEIKYSLADNSAIFEINERSGLITTTGQLDYEIQTFITLKVAVKDNGNPVLSSFCVLTINITDINDNKPLFTNTTFNFVVYENVVLNSAVAYLSVFDSDAGKNSRLTFSIMFPSPLVEKTFFLNSSTGIIHNLAALDRESHDFYQFLVLVQDNGDPTLSSTATVNLTILDVNDNQPVFYPREYYVNIPSNQSDSFIVNVTAVDRDQNDVISYDIVNKNPLNTLFNINQNTGTVSCTKIIELKSNDVYTMNLIARDSEGHVSNISVLYITVISPEDDLPQFEMDSYSFITEENVQRGTYIGKVETTSKTNILYHVYSGDPDGIFVISKDGEIRTSRDLDHEKQGLINLQVMARTLGQKALLGWTSVVILVEDVNDNSPEFQYPQHLISVKSTAPVGSIVYKARSRDPDLGNGGIVMYEMIPDNYQHWFSIHASGNVVVARDLSQTTNYSPAIMIIASDFGIPQLSSVLNLTINIIKDNSQPPFIHTNFGLIPLLQNVPVNQPFFSVTASDPDGDKSDDICFHLFGTDNATYFFGIFPHGDLYVKRPLWLTSQSEFSLQAIATDRGHPRLNSTSVIDVSVLNVKRHQLFQKDVFRFDVYENTNPGTVVGKVDFAAKFQNLEVKLVERYSYFTFDRVTNEIKTKQVIDREQWKVTSGTDDYILFAKASYKNDIGLHMVDLATIIIEVKDKNDNVPIFTQLKYVVDIEENEKVGAVILQLIAFDKDEDENAKLNFSVVSSSFPDAVIVDGEGRIVLNRTLENKHIFYFNLSVQAMNIAPPYFYSTCFIEVNIHDLNNNKPQFAESSIVKRISEDSVVGRKIYHANASDGDSGRNSLLAYTIISGNQESNFEIDLESGEVTLARELNFEDIKSYVLTISARDSGVEPLSTTQVLIVNVTDVNDNSPRFMNCPSSLKLEEDRPVDSEAIHCLAVDSDIGDNGFVYYSISREKPTGNFFRIDDNGTVYINKPLDREQFSVYKIDIEARDNAIPPSSQRLSTKTISIELKDVNDNSPKFTSPPAVYFESASVGMYITTVTAWDPDLGLNGNFTFSKGNGNDASFFHVDNNGRIIFAKTPAGKVLYTLSVIVTDLGPGPRETLQELSIFKYKEGGLSFTQKQYFSTIVENDPAGTFVVNVTATTTRQTENTKVRYFMTNDSSEGFLSLDSVTGVIALKNKIDRESKHGHQVNLVICAVDVNSIQPKSTSVNVLLTILDINDNIPTFSEYEYIKDISEYATIGSNIITLQARDEDEGRNGSIVYQIVSGNSRRVFYIDNVTGQISLSDTLDHEVQSLYIFNVTASDNGEPSLSSWTVVSLNIIDVNDNVPVFQRLNYSFTVVENSPIGTVIGQIVARDPDSGENGQVIYSLTGDDARLFIVNAKSGTLRAAFSFDREKIAFYLFKVVASDKGNPMHSTVALVYVSILDENDNSPIFFSTQSYTATVFENSLIDTPVITVNASDEDIGLNSTLVYSIFGGNNDEVFRISNDGTLFTKAVLDRENIAQYNLEITVRDSAAIPSQRRYSTALVTVNVADDNDHSPYFISRDVIHVREDYELAKPFAFILAKDNDTGLNGKVLYELQGYSAKKFFQVGQYSGELSLKQTLNQEKLLTGYINITVEAKDLGIPPKRNQQYIQIVVDDVNDNTPMFQPHVEILYVYENISIGTELLRITAVDDDQGLNGKVEYGITAGNVNDTFSIHPIDGILTLVKQLDRESLQNYLIDITAFDFGSPTRENLTAVRIHVIDVNDNRPYFIKSPSSKTIKENIQYVTDLAQFVAVDDDEGKNSEVVYSILHPTQSPFLHIDNTTGVVTLIAPLDREVQASYSVIVEARDKGTPAMYTQTKFSISVGDVNDNSPLFVNETIKPTIVEGSPVGSRLCVMNATDADSGNNADISYTLIQDFGRFRIDSNTGEIFSIAELDREVHGTEFELTVKAKDNGNPSRVTCATVIGRIEDIDDNVAEFKSKTYSAYIPEGAPTGTFVIGISAVDKDEGLNGKVIYKLEGSSTEFLIQPDTGYIFTTGRIPNSPATYNLKIRAINATNTIQDTTALVITTSNRKNFPSFDIPRTVYNISEDAKPGYFILTVKALDNPSIRIASGDPDELFSLGIDSRNITLNKNLDYEKKRHYSLWLKASLNTKYSTFINIQVFVIDFNDNIPLFEQSHYDVAVVENDSTNVSVSCIVAEDRDSGAFGFIEYKILEASALKLFRIDRHTGCIYTIVGIDREQNLYFNFTVQARDNGIPFNTNSVSVRVIILDGNDNPPILDKLKPVYISEDELPTLLVTAAFANDEDETSNLLYSLKPEGNFGNAFNIDPISGEIFLTKKLDREIVGRYPLVIHVTDGKFSDNTPLIVMIKDVDDNPPTFIRTDYSVTFLELQPVRSVVMQLNVSDKDIGRNSDVVYFFKRSSASEKFRVDSSGTITVATQLRFIKPTRENGVTNLYNLTVYAKSPNHPSSKPTANIIVEVTDANDHHPVFERNEYHKYIPSVSKRGDVVTTVHAVDDYDVGLNSEVLYTVVGGNGTNIFTVEPTTGRVTVNSDISSEKDKLFLLEIQAKDRGEPDQISPKSVTVFIMVTIENQHPPKFTKKKYAKELKENFNVGQEFLRVFANDSDTGMNGRVTYSILPGKQGEFFNIDTHTGSLTVANVKLDYEYLKQYSFDIQAQDGSQKPRTDNATVTVTVLDYNDNLPEFQKSSYDVNVVENNQIGSEVVVVSATDRDTIDNTITYTLAGEDRDYFIIDQSSGKITTNIIFDYESRTMFTLTVLAKDNGNPPRTSDGAVIVKVRGINEFRPEFKKKAYVFSIREDASVGTIVGQVSATDEDNGPDGLVQFILVDPSGRNNNLDVDENTGNIYVCGRLDHETVDLVQLTVLAKNPVQRILSADNTDTANVTIEIQDINDPPRFLQDFLKVSVKEDISVGGILGNFTAVDDDTNKNFLSPFKYSISSGNINGSFKLETVGEHAIIKTNKRLDREVTALFNLTIAATDITDLTSSGFTFLVVEVKDINDNAPFLKPGICPGHIREELAAGAKVLRFDAIDNDIDPNKDPYTFQITNKERVPFVIDKLTLELKTSAILDREKVPLYALQINIFDSGYPKQFSSTICHVIVDDVNDNRPSADTLNVEVNVPATEFLGGVISDVSPRDDDEIKEYSCKVEGGHKDIFDFEPNTCILNMKKPILEHYTLNVFAHDSLYRVSYSLNISFNKVLETASQRSVILRLSGISPEEFLTVMNYLPCISGYEKQIFSIQRTDSTKTDVLMAHLKNGVYISKDELAQILTNCKSSLEQKLGAKILHTNYNVCSTFNPCTHGQCEPRIILLSENRTSLYSGTKIFVSVYHKATFRCICDPGYYGELCLSTKVCEGKPCKNNGQCIPTVQGFKCLCPANFTGKVCDTSVDLCDPNPCSNTSQCLSTREGAKCQCDFGGRGERCELSSFGFKPLSYMKFSNVASTNGITKTNISLEIATVERNALVLYNQDSNTDENYITLEIIEGLLRYSFNIGNGVVRITSDVIVSDGRWHAVTAVIDKQFGYLNVDGKNSSFTGKLPGIVKFKLGISPLFIGGVPSLDVISNHGSSYDFVGCMRDIYVNNVELVEDMAILTDGVSNSCPRVSECQQSSCQGDSTCLDKWFNTLCQCTDDAYTGSRCNKKVEPLTLSDGSVLRFKFDPSYLRQTEFLQRQKGGQSRRRRNVENRESFSMNFRARNDNAFLWRAQDNHGNYTQLQTKSGLVYLSLGNSVEEEQQLVISNKYVNNGHWFSISLSRDLSSDALTLNVNGSKNQTQPERSYVFFSGTWTLGSLKTSDESVSGFQGCISKIKINGETISLDVNNQYGLLTLESGNLTSGCESPDYCASSPCPDSKCVNNWHSYSCLVSLDGGNTTLSVGAIAGIVFFCILLIAVIVAVIAVKKRRTRNEFAARLSGKTNRAIERDNSGSSGSESFPSRKRLSRHSLTDSGVDIRNRSSSLSHETLKNTSSSNANVIALGSPDEYTIVTSQQDSVSDRDKGFTDSESEYGGLNHGGNLTISSIPSRVNNVQSTTSNQRPSSSKHALLKYNNKVPYLINRGYLQDAYQSSRSTSPSDEPESIEMKTYSNDIDNAEQYSIGNASFATFSDLNDPSYNPSRYSDDRMRYKPSLERFSESGDSDEERRLSNLPNSFEPHVDSSGESSDGGFTSSEYDYEQRASFEDEEEIGGSGSRVCCEAPKSLARNRSESYGNISDCEREMNVDDPVEIDTNYLHDIVGRRANPNRSRGTLQIIAHLGDDENVEIV